MILEEKRRVKLVYEELERIMEDERLYARLIRVLTAGILRNYKNENKLSYKELTAKLQTKEKRIDYHEESIKKFVYGTRFIPEKDVEALSGIIEIEGAKDIIINETAKLINSHIYYNEYGDFRLIPITREILKGLEKPLKEDLEEINKIPEIEEWIYDLKPIPSESLNKAIEESLQNESNELFKKVKNLRINEPIDVQNIQFLKNSIDFYEKHPHADMLFSQFFSKQYDLFGQVLDKKIEPNEFSVELKKLIEIARATIELENDK
ncbi:hypothetical protein ACFOZ1_15880 [Gracilibacillus marinus]|uniref:Uncharacterized protein n=1 Tax=Gracilibacillus marinus TaxID=630535 RepID=A0ABV8W1Y3_9BACI